MAALSVRYLGWSSIELTFPSGRRVLIDPNYTPFDGESFATLEDYRGADLMLVSHGHFDHCQDAPAIVAAGAMEVVTSAPLKHLIERRAGAGPARVHAAADGDAFELAGVRVAVQGWSHRGLADRWPRLLAKRPSGILRMRAALRGFITSPLLGFHLRAEGAPAVTVIGEAFHGDTDLARVGALGTSHEPGVALVALEPGLEGATAAATARLGPAAVVAYSAHQVMWRYFGLPEVDAGAFRDKLAALHPGVDVRVLEPRQTACFA